MYIRSVCVCSFVLGALVFCGFATGLAVATTLLHRRDRVAQFCAERWSLESLVNFRSSDCSLCNSDKSNL